VASVFAEASLLALFKQIREDCLYCSTMLSVGFVKSHHVDENDMTFVHEKIAEQIKALGLACPTTY
jgi:hypothetical protein